MKNVASYKFLAVDTKIGVVSKELQKRTGHLLPFLHELLYSTTMATLPW